MKKPVDDPRATGHEALFLLAAEIKPFVGTIVLCHDEGPYRLCGVAEDDCDLYYVLEGKGPRRRTWASAVGPMVPLAGRLPAADYERLERTFALNGSRARPMEVIVERGFQRKWLAGSDPDADVPLADRQAEAARGYAREILSDFPARCDRIATKLLDALEPILEKHGLGALRPKITEDIGRRFLPRGWGRDGLALPAALERDLQDLERQLDGWADRFLQEIRGEIALRAALAGSTAANDAILDLDLDTGSCRTWDLDGLLREVHWALWPEGGLAEPRDSDDRILSFLDRTAPHARIFLRDWLGAEPWVAERIEAHRGDGRLEAAWAPLAYFCLEHWPHAVWPGDPEDHALIMRDIRHRRDRQCPDEAPAPGAP
ncbi:hypothetical protein LAZ40_04205 [Cereibacter sphaeroides]|uniref:hypothetical protein n=1 Tax=Cereibacter sphaeroides TaxID=1063 RepID=UPI001F44089D|nr:hypothetical protein [Cereibacter sphaeroides]MCE6958257.1 hypothetical protein [Cereibacter sphaeroides]MCE6971196.1 hypothetical protein [Cereibacter sphaeroides]